MTREPDLALSFGQAVGDYDRGRPGYPDAAVEWMLEQSSPVTDVVDVGAGTGKFTASLVARGLTVTAVEPDDVMRARLTANLSTVIAVQGTGETLPLPAASADLVAFAQAWHWVDEVKASAEVARVLRPTGSLALIWNIRDENVDWVARLGEIMGSSAAEEYDSVTPPLGDTLQRSEHAEFHWDNPVTRDGLLAMVTSRSYVIAMPVDERAAMLKRIERLLDTHPELAGRTRYVMPYVTRVTLARPA